jgi:ankyrin repeat protein
VLLEHGAQLAATDHLGDTALLAAAANDNADVIAALINHGADCGVRNHAGSTALWTAVSKGHLSAARVGGHPGGHLGDNE